MSQECFASPLQTNEVSHSTSCSSQTWLSNTELECPSGMDIVDGQVHMGKVQQNLGVKHYLEFSPPALMAKCSIPSDATFKETSFCFAVFSKFVFLPFFTVVSTNSCIQRAVQLVTAFVTHGFYFGVNVDLWVLQVLSERWVQYFYVWVTLLCRRPYLAQPPNF